MFIDKKYFQINVGNIFISKINASVYKRDSSIVNVLDKLR